jgi:putative transposase
MSRKYKFNNKDGLYFVSFATVLWIDVFIREEYCQVIVESLDYCRKPQAGARVPRVPF